MVSSVNATVLQRDGDHDVRHRFGVTRDGRATSSSDSVSASSPSNSRHRAIEIGSGSGSARSGTSMALPLNASRDDSCWMGGALWRVDVAVDAPMSV